MCKSKIYKVMVGGVSVFILVSMILVIWFVMRTGGQRNEAKSQIIENKISLIGVELNDNAMGSSSHTTCISVIVGLVILATLLKMAIMFYCCRKKMGERKVKQERKKE